MSLKGIIQHRNGIILSVDGIGSRLLGCRSEYIVGKSIFDFLDQKGSEAMSHAINQERNGDFNLRVNKQDGSRVILKIYPDTSSSPLFGIREEMFEMMEQPDN